MNRQHTDKAAAKRRQAQDVLKKSNEQLEIKVQERTAELKMAIDALGGERQRLHEVLNNLPAYVILLNSDYRVPFANKFFEERFGKSNGKRCYEYLFGRTEPCDICETYTVMKTNKPHRWEWAGPDGRNYDIYDFPFTDIDGSNLIMEVGLDITDRKIGEAELDKYRNRLEELVKERTSQLRLANEQLKAEIAERNKAEKTLQTTLQRFYTVLSSMYSGVLLVNEDSRVEFANTAFCEMYDLKDSSSEIVGLTAQQMIDMIKNAYSHPDDAVSRIQEIVALGQPVKGEEVALRGDLTCIRNYIPLNVDGQSRGRLWNHVDITERKQAEEALIQARSEAERSAQELQAVFAAVPAAVWIARDPKCDDIAGNAVANQFYEAEEGENVSANASSVRRFFRDGKELSPEELPMQYAATHNIDTGQDEFEVLLPSGKRRCLLGGATPLRDPDGQVSGCVGAFIDISKRKQAEEQLAEARAEAVQHAAELESFFSNMTDGVVLHDAEGNAMISNCAARDILGADPRRSVDERVEQYKICKLDGTAMKPEETASGRALRGETVKELRYKLTSGVRDKIISVSSSPVRAADGTILGATTVFRDVTDQAEYERQKEELFDREHNIARVLQQAIMPQAVPAEILGYRFATKYRPALNEAEVGGDFYDVFELADNKIAVLIGDVVGKGLAAAIRVASARHAIRSYAYIDPWPEMVLTMANEALCRDTGDVSQILTAFFAILDIENGTFTCANAGHEPPIICCSHGDCEEIEIGGMPLGLMLGIAYEQSSRRLDPGDIVVMVTDGITEARAPGIVLFGKERLIEFVRQRRNTTLDEITTGILKAATMHAGGQLQDDAAVVVFSPQAGIVEKIIA